MLCFLVLMQNDDGLIDKAPIYIAEKTHLLRHGYDAFAALDIYNMRKVVAWCARWGVELPDPVKNEWELQEVAFEELKDKGFNL